MTGGPLAVPPPVSRQDEYMAAMCQRLDVQNDLLGQILGRLPASAGPAVSAEPAEVVSIREPLASPPATDQPGVSSPVVSVAPARRASAKKAPARPAATEEASHG